DVDKAKLILNDIVKYYNVRGVEQRSEQSRLTLDFLDSRIQLIAQDLTDSEADVEGYKKNQGIVDVATEATYQTTKKGKFEGELVQAEIDLNIMQMTKEFLADSKNKYELIPTTVSDETVKAGITNYNELVLSRMNLVRTAKEGNIALSKMNDRIDALRANINTSLDRAIAQQNKVISDMRLQLGVTDSRLGNIPTQERQYRDIKRKQTIKEQLYLFLMQRREDTALMIANTTPKGVIVDKAFSLSEPVTMKKRMILLLAFVFSLILPPLILVIKKVLRNKFDTKDELKKLTDIPVIGEICKDNTGDNIVVKQGSVSTVAELFRAVRSNLQQFFLSGEDDKVVLMTSTVSGEGKSFVSVNLAQTLAITNNDLKVLLVGMDIRKPRIAEYLSISSSKGLTDYVARTGMNLDDVIQKNPNGLAFDVITSGPIPPNPAELLLSQRVDDMFAELRKRYDYIVVDTAPVGLVSDTLTLSRIGDATIYVCRANYTTKTDIQYANSIYEEGRLKKMSIILNDTIVRKGYGYGYGENRESQK
ncbi:MAG: polysaccharide biosynthesis tyrosine autokinase, partial [Bacteroidales bacterium]|nr:polysaccharide biosynthesis tyrosine autokinase [Bacteroidales bacterium]